MAARDFTGERFGRLVAIHPAAHVAGTGNIKWVFKCDCGNETTIVPQSAKAGRTQSCGCYNREAVSLRSRTHGQGGPYNKTTEYRIWANMRSRCQNPRLEAFKNYGGRGITVCDRWKSFENFFADMGRRPPDLTLERMDNDGNYEPSNCKWATRMEQANNTRRQKLRRH